MIRGLCVLALSILLTSCIVKHMVAGPRLTGTCEGACNHYISCKPGHTKADRERCQSECPEVFSDRDSLMAFESLSCQNAVEFVDGMQPQAATQTP